MPSHANHRQVDLRVEIVRTAERDRRSPDNHRAHKSLVMLLRPGGTQFGDDLAFAVADRRIRLPPAQVEDQIWVR